MAPHTTTTTTKPTPADPSNPSPILRLPDELLDKTLALLHNPTPDLHAFEIGLAAPQTHLGMPPAHNVAGDLGALASTCRRLYLLATPRLYDTLFLYPARQPKRIARLIWALKREKGTGVGVGRLCRRLFVIRPEDEGDDWLGMAGAFPGTTVGEVEGHAPEEEVFAAMKRLPELYGLLKGFGAKVRVRHGPFEDGV